MGQNPRWLSAPCEHSERRPPVFVWSHHSLLLYRSLKIQTEQVCNYLVVIFQIIMNLMHTCRYMYWQQTEWNIGPTLRHLMFHDLQILEEMEYICIANNRVTCITRAYLTLLGTGSCTRALTIGNFSSKNCFLGKKFKQIYLNAKKQTKILYSFLGFHLYISWIIIKSMFSP